MEEDSSELEAVGRWSIVMLRVIRSYILSQGIIQLGPSLFERRLSVDSLESGIAGGLAPQ